MNIHWKMLLPRSTSHTQMNIICMKAEPTLMIDCFRVSFNPTGENHWGCAQKYCGVSRSLTRGCMSIVLLQVNDSQWSVLKFFEATFALISAVVSWSIVHMSTLASICNSWLFRNWSMGGGIFIWQLLSILEHHQYVMSNMYSNSLKWPFNLTPSQMAEIEQKKHVFIPVAWHLLTLDAFTLLNFIAA